MLSRAEDDFWEAAVPPRRAASSADEGIRPDLASLAAPLLHGTVVRLNARPVRRLVRDLLKAAGEGGEADASLAALRSVRLDALEFLKAAITQDHDAIEQLAISADVVPEALGVVAHLAAVPLLHACARRLNSSVPDTWMKGYCPICAAWPALGELRGLERNRRLRCGRCASDWMLPVLHCPFCGEVHHDQLGSLLPEGQEQTRRIDVCRSCNGYIKTFSVLRPMSLHALLMEDLGSVELDLAAQERGYARPARRAFPLTMDIERVSSLPRVLARWT